MMKKMIQFQSQIAQGLTEIIKLLNQNSLKIIIFFISTISSFSLVAQDCDCFLNYYKAESLYFNKTDKIKSIKYYRKAFEDPKFGSLADVYNALDIVYRMDSFEYAKTLLEQSLLKEGRLDFLNRIDKYYPNLKYNKERLQKIADSVRINRKPFDSLLINDLAYMEQRDQFIRENEKMENNSILNEKTIDKMNYLWLKEIILSNGGKLPTYDQVGDEGLEYITTILVHLELDFIIDLWPYLIRSIHEDKAPINDIIVYQLDRNMISGDNIVYLENGKLVKKHTNKAIPNSHYYYQNLGGMDVNIVEEKAHYWWPFNPELDKDNTNKIRKALCLDSLDNLLTRLSYYKNFANSDDFVKKVK